MAHTEKELSIRIGDKCIKNPFRSTFRYDAYERLVPVSVSLPFILTLSCRRLLRAHGCFCSLQSAMLKLQKRGGTGNEAKGLLVLHSPFFLYHKIKDSGQQYENKQAPFASPKYGRPLDNNDLNQVVASSGFSENKGLGGVLSLAGS